MVKRGVLPSIFSDRSLVRALPILLFDVVKLPDRAAERGPRHGITAVTRTPSKNPRRAMGPAADRFVPSTPRLLKS